LAVSETPAERYELHDPDVRLMLQVRDGNAAAFEELVLRYQSRLLTVLEHLVGNRELAEDLAQEVFLRVFRARKSYEPGAKFSTWLFTIANNVASNARRSKSRRKEVGVPEKSVADSSPLGLDQLAKAASGQMPARMLDKSESAHMVRLAVESLGERQRMALLLSKFEGMCYQDIAETMGLSVQAIKSLLSRARVNLKEILTPYVDAGARPVASSANGDDELEVS
jgi:RNA polymerase sigma-70 factor (ECF subfamily)